MLTISLDTSDNNAKSEAALKLGLLFNKDGPKKNPKQSVDYLKQHFELLHQADTVQSQIDKARVNLGIVKAMQ